MIIPGPRIDDPVMSTMGTTTSTLDFTRITSGGYSQRGLGFPNQNSVAIQLIVTLTANPDSAYTIVSGAGTYSVAAEATHNVIVKFNGSGQSPGTKTGQVRVEWWYGSNNFSNNVYNLSGIVAQSPDLVNGSYGINFGQVYLGSAKDGVCRIRNNGSLNLAITGIGLSGVDAARFSLTGGTGSGTLAPGQYRDINVRYLADAAGNHSAFVSVSLTYDGISYTGDNSMKLPLIGETLNPPVARLWLDDTLIAEETSPLTGADLDKMFLSIKHPYANGGLNDQSVEYPMKRGSYYTVIYDFGGSRDGRVLEKRQKQMNAYRRSGYADTSREVVTETLNVMGMTWMRDTTLNEKLLEEISGVVSIRHHRFGVVAQESGYYIDVKAQQSSSASRSNDGNAVKAHFKAINHLASAMEHGVLEQMQVDRPAVSTVKLLQLANQGGGKIFRATSATYAAIKPQLVNYSDQDKEKFQTSVNQGNILILPANGGISLQEWAGKGYIDYKITGTQMHCGMIIGGDYFGGYGVVKAPVSIPAAGKEITVRTLPAATIPKIASTDPVDMTGGHFMHGNTDLALSGGKGGLAFKRSYFGGNHDKDGDLGYGWSHNYNLFAEEHSSSDLGLGTRLPTDSVALIVASVATLDLMTGDSLKEWMSGALIGKWGMDSLTDNAVSIHLDTDVLTYIKQPDGSFALPPGVNASLVLDNGQYRLEDRFDRVIRFNADLKAASVTDADGNAVSFAYTGGRLSRISDGFGHSLTLTYTGARLTSVADSAGRSVAYAYAGNNLTAWTDPEGKAWTFGYDGDHRIISLKNPENITTVTNAYDSLGRVKTQTVPRQTGSVTYNLYFSGYRNVEEDALGHGTVYRYDRKKRLIAVENALGHTTRTGYDGRNHAVETTDPRGNTTTYAYDGHNNLTGITNALGKTTLQTYDGLYRLTAVTDPLGHGVHYAYDSEHHLERITFRPSSGQPIYTQNSYSANGLVQSSTDGRGVVTAYTYDTYGNPDTLQTGSAPAVDYAYDGIGRMTGLTDRKGALTTFAYDKRGLLLTRTDPALKSSILTYYNDGTLKSVTDRNGSTVSYTYTPTGKPGTVRFPDGSVRTLTYDGRDNLTRVQDGSGTATYTYDALNRLTSSTDANGFTVSYAYDEAGNLKTLTYPGNKTVTYTHDALNRLATVTDWQGRIAAYTYDDAGRPTGLTQFNGAVTAYAYDDADRLTGLENRTGPGGAAIATYRFTLDGNGNRTGVTQQVPLSANPAAASMDFTVHAQTNRLVSAGTDTFAYDDEGRLISAYGSALTHDPEHRLTAIIGTTATQFRYDGSGNRLQAVRNGVATRYIYDASGNLLAEADASNQIRKYYIYGAGLLALVEPTNAMFCYHLMPPATPRP
nr:choice-of-anchor D domain-containing protein [Desulfobacula sp.]